MRIAYVLLVLMMLYWFLLILPFLLPFVLILVIIGYIKFRKLKREMYHFEDLHFDEKTRQDQEYAIHDDVIDVEFTEREE